MAADRLSLLLPSVPLLFPMSQLIQPALVLLNLKQVTLGSLILRQIDLLLVQCLEDAHAQLRVLLELRCLDAICLIVACALPLRLLSISNLTDGARLYVLDARTVSARLGNSHNFLLNLPIMEITWYTAEDGLLGDGTCVRNRQV